MISLLIDSNSIPETDMEGDAFMKRLISVLAVLMLLINGLGLTAAAADGENLTVKNYRELLEAVNDKKVERVRISSRYKTGTVPPGEFRSILSLEGRTLTIVSETEEAAVIDGSVSIDGPGTVIFDNVVIRAQQDETGLCVSKADVTIESVRGGDSKANHGRTAVVISDNATLHIGSAVGGNAKNGIAGDGILVGDHSAVFAREIRGGNCENGVGGAGIIVVDGSEITVTETICGGNGAVNPGKAVLAARNARIEGPAVRADGNLLESKKAPDPKKINNFALLQNALRNGETLIRLDPSYKDGRTADTEDCIFFSFTDETVIIEGAYDDKPQKIDGGFRFVTGNWELKGLDISSKMGGALLANEAHVRIEGNLTSSSNGNSTITVYDGGIVEITGDVAYKGKAPTLFSWTEASFRSKEGLPAPTIRRFM